VSEKGRHERLAADRLQARSCFLRRSVAGVGFPGGILWSMRVPVPNPNANSDQNWITVSKKSQCRGSQSVKRWLRESYRRMASSAPGGTGLCHHRSSCDATAHTSGRRGTQRTRARVEVREIRTLPGQSDSSWFARAVLRGYRAAIAAGHRPVCRYTPSCSSTPKKPSSDGEWCEADLGFAPRASLPPLRARGLDPVPTVLVAFKSHSGKDR